MQEQTINYGAITFNDDEPANDANYADPFAGCVAGPDASDYDPSLFDEQAPA